MKKFLVLIALILSPCVIADEVDGLTEPEWKDFVPPSYADVEEPKGLGKLNETASYWYKRRIEFNEAIEKCRSIEFADDK